MKREYRSLTEREIPESAIVSACIKWLWANGCFVWRNNTGAANHSYTRQDGSTGYSHIKYGYPGSPDIIGVNKWGRWIGIECKRAGQNLKPHQEKFKQQIEEHAGVFVLARSVDDLEANKTLLLSSRPSAIAYGALHARDML